MTGVWKIPRVLYEVHLQMVAVSSVMLVFLGVFFWSFFLKKQKMIPCFVVVKQMCSSTFRLAGGHCSVHKDHVKSWVFHADLGYKLPKNNLHFKKEKKRPPGKENPWFFFVSISPTHLHKNAAKHFSRWCFFYVTSIDSVDPPLGEAGHSWDSGEVSHLGWCFLETP